MVQECPYAHDDPDHDNPPLLHEMGDQDQVLHKFKLSMSGMNPFMASLGGGMMGPGMLGNTAMAATLLNSVTGKNGMSEENRQQVLQAVAASTGMSAEVLRSLEPEQLQGVVQMAAMRSMQGIMGGGGGGGPEADVMHQMMASNPEAAQSMMQVAAASGLPPVAVMQMMAAGGGGQEAVMQMAAAGGVPPAVLKSMMASMASASLGQGGEHTYPDPDMSYFLSGGEGGGNQWEQFIKQSLAAGNGAGFFKGITKALQFTLMTSLA